MGSKYKCVERPVGSVFPDYLSVYCDYNYVYKNIFQIKLFTFEMAAIFHFTSVLHKILNTNINKKGNYL